MSGYVGSDGSALAGALNPSSVIQGLQVDGSGNLKTVAAGSPAETPTNINQINGATPSRTNGLPIGGDNGSTVVVLPLEALNNLLKASLYGKSTNPGDTPLLLDSSGRPLVSLASINGFPPTVDNSGTTPALRVSLCGQQAVAGDTPLAVNASGFLKVVGQANVGTNIGNVGSLNGLLPYNATAVHASASGTNAIVTATLAAATGKSTYLYAFEITGLPATTLSSGDVTVSGVSGGPFTYEFVQSTTGQNTLQVTFAIPVISSAQNTAITVSVAALGASSAKVSVVAHGYQL